MGSVRSSINYSPVIRPLLVEQRNETIRLLLNTNRGNRAC